MVDLEQLEKRLIEYNAKRHGMVPIFPRDMLATLAAIRRNGISTSRYPTLRRVMSFHFDQVRGLQRPALNMQPARQQWDGLQ